MKNNDEYHLVIEEKRLKTFRKWPFGDEYKCNKKAMAAAGFYFIGNKKEPDLVRCFVCRKELDGWEEDDDPREEHKKHAAYCQFIQLNKDYQSQTFQDVHELEMHQQISMATKLLQTKIAEFKKQAAKTRESIVELV